jgi:catechol 2,3-dioxygenase-like lactoylglutathione lyase family enzyme
MVTGLNHVTLAVADLDRSLAFYTDLLGFRPLVRWPGGAYLSAGSLWLCLSLDPTTRQAPLPEYTHLALSITASEVRAFADRLVAADVVFWKPNSSEGESLYILDPDHHKLELHVGDLASRLASLRDAPYEGLQWLDPA